MSNRFSEMRARLDGDTWLDELARASLNAAEVRHQRRRRGADPFIMINVGADIDNQIFATVAEKVQNAVARVAHYMEDENSDANRVLSGDRSRARLYPLYHQRRRIIFGFSDPDEELDTLFEPIIPSATMAELAAAELMQALPSNADDNAALEAILGRHKSTRNAVKDLVEAAQQAAGLEMRVHTYDEEFTSTLTRVQAVTLNADLVEETELETTQFTIQGQLDGARMRRRIFYFESPQRDYQGGYDPELAPVVREFIDRPARAEIEGIRPKKRAGTPGRWSYRLLSLTEPAQPMEGPGLFKI